MKAIKIFGIVGFFFLLGACNINLGKKGNGNVVIENRPLSGNFSGIKSSAGIQVFLTAGASNKVEVEADENLQQYISTEVINNMLVITSTENIRKSRAKKVHVTFVELNKIEASSGSSIIGNSVIKSESLEISGSSGAEIEMEIFAKSASVQTSSGADVEIAGKASTLFASASSGSEIDAKNLQTLSCTAEASSGADITVHTAETIEARASSGAEITYYGSPTKVSANKTSAGSINSK